MAITDQAQKELLSFCALLLKEHGLQFSPDNPVIPTLYVFYKEMQLNNQNNKAIALQIREAVSRINPTEFKFYSEDAAWKFQKGITIRRVLTGLLVVLILWIAQRHWATVNDIDRAKVIIDAAGNMSELIKLVEKGSQGIYFIDFTAAKGDSIQFFKEFQKLNAKTVRVYLGKDLGKSPGKH